MSRITTWVKVIDNQLVNGVGGYAVSSAIDTLNAREYSLAVKVNAGATPDVKADFQITSSTEGDAANIMGAKDVADYRVDWTTPETGTPVISSVKSGSKVDGFTLPATRWFRIKATGNAGNGADTYVSVFLAITYES